MMRKPTCAPLRACTLLLVTAHEISHQRLNARHGSVRIGAVRLCESQYRLFEREKAGLSLCGTDEDRAELSLMHSVIKHS